MLSSITIDHKDRVHRHLFNFITSSYCIQSHLFIINKDSNYKDLLFNKDLETIKEKEVHRFLASKTTNNIITYPFDLIYHAIKKDYTKTTIKITFENASRTQPIIEKLATSGLAEIIASLISQTFLSYWEENKEDLIKIKGNNIVDFGKVLRDAFAHHGKINIKNNNSNVEYLGLRYSKINNGQIVINNDLSIADIINILLTINSILNHNQTKQINQQLAPNAPPAA